MVPNNIFRCKEAEIKTKTKKSFGYQWTKFSQMSCDFRDNFLNYIYPLKEDFFKDKIGLDAGCGFGRHILNASKFGAKMVGIDSSDAIYATSKNTKGIKNIYLCKADIFNLPFRKETFDFVYSIGVLHHLSEPQSGFDSLLELVKPNGAIFIWVYNKSRRKINFVLEIIRNVTKRLPFSLLRCLSFVTACIDWTFFILPFKIIKLKVGKSIVLERIVFARVKVYSQYVFQVVYADWFDRLSAPVRFYYDKSELLEWFGRANLKNIKITPTGNYGWRGYAEK